MQLTHPHGIGPDCRRINSVVSTIGDKWSVMIVMVLIVRPHRFNEMKRAIGGISQQMLARTLRALERDGAVARTVHATVPPQVAVLGGRTADLSLGRSEALAHSTGIEV
jgi:DNA-binding HxlR family transcriptional regulator